jgi:hypothetical protein
MSKIIYCYFFKKQKLRKEMNLTINAYHGSYDQKRNQIKFKDKEDAEIAEPEPAGKENLIFCRIYSESTINQAQYEIETAYPDMKNFYYYVSTLSNSEPYFLAILMDKHLFLRDLTYIGTLYIPNSKLYIQVVYFQQQNIMFFHTAHVVSFATTDEYDVMIQEEILPILKEQLKTQAVARVPVCEGAQIIWIGWSNHSSSSSGRADKDTVPMIVRYKSFVPFHSVRDNVEIQQIEQKHQKKEQNSPSILYTYDTHLCTRTFQEKMLPELKKYFDEIVIWDYQTLIANPNEQYPFYAGVYSSQKLPDDTSTTTTNEFNSLLMIGKKMKAKERNVIIQKWQDDGLKQLRKELEDLFETDLYQRKYHEKVQSCEQTIWETIKKMDKHTPDIKNIIEPLYKENLLLCKEKQKRDILLQILEQFQSRGQPYVIVKQELEEERNRFKTEFDDKNEKIREHMNKPKSASESAPSSVPVSADPMSTSSVPVPAPVPAPAPAPAPISPSAISSPNLVYRNIASSSSVSALVPSSVPTSVPASVPASSSVFQDARSHFEAAKPFVSNATERNTKEHSKLCEENIQEYERKLSILNEYRNDDINILDTSKTTGYISDLKSLCETDYIKNILQIRELTKDIEKALENYKRDTIEKIETKIDIERSKERSKKLQEIRRMREKFPGKLNSNLFDNYQKKSYDQDENNRDFAVENFISRYDNGVTLTYPEKLLNDNREVEQLYHEIMEFFRLLEEKEASLGEDLKKRLDEDQKKRLDEADVKRQTSIKEIQRKCIVLQNNQIECNLGDLMNQLNQLNDEIAAMGNDITKKREITKKYLEWQKIVEQIDKCKEQAEQKITVDVSKDISKLYEPIFNVLDEQLRKFPDDDNLKELREKISNLVEQKKQNVIQLRLTFFQSDYNDKPLTEEQKQSKRQESSEMDSQIKKLREEFDTRFQVLLKEQEYAQFNQFRNEKIEFLNSILKQIEQTKQSFIYPDDVLMNQFLPVIAKLIGNFDSLAAEINQFRSELNSFTVENIPAQETQYQITQQMNAIRDRLYALQPETTNLHDQINEVIQQEKERARNQKETELINEWEQKRKEVEGLNAYIENNTGDIIPVLNKAIKTAADAFANLKEAEMHQKQSVDNQQKYEEAKTVYRDAEAQVQQQITKIENDYVKFQENEKERLRREHEEAERKRKEQEMQFKEFYSKSVNEISALILEIREWNVKFKDIKNSIKNDEQTRSFEELNQTFETIKTHLEELQKNEESNSEKTKEKMDQYQSEFDILKVEFESLKEKCKNFIISTFETNFPNSFDECQKLKKNWESIKENDELKRSFDLEQFLHSFPNTFDLIYRMLNEYCVQYAELERDNWLSNHFPTIFNIQDLSNDAAITNEKYKMLQEAINNFRNALIDYNQNKNTLNSEKIQKPFLDFNQKLLSGKEKTELSKLLSVCAETLKILNNHTKTVIETIFNRKSETLFQKENERNASAKYENALVSNSNALDKLQKEGNEILARYHQHLRRKRQQQQKRKAEQEQNRKRTEQEEHKRKKAEQEKRKTEEQRRRALQEEEQKRKKAEQERRRASQEEQKRKMEQERRRKAAQAEKQKTVGKAATTAVGVPKDVVQAMDPSHSEENVVLEKKKNESNIPQISTDYHNLERLQKQNSTLIENMETYVNENFDETSFNDTHRKLLDEIDALPFNDVIRSNRQSFFDYYKKIAKNLLRIQYLNSKSVRKIALVIKKISDLEADNDKYTKLCKQLQDKYKTLTEEPSFFSSILPFKFSSSHSETRPVSYKSQQHKYGL